jgi:flagellar hook-associated protein 1
MGSTFSGINTALTSLYAQRRGLDVTGENIANANTEGFSRQKVRLHALSSSSNPGMYTTTNQVGAGVGVSGVERSRNEYLEERGRAEHASSAYLASQKSSYDLIESVLAEPSDTALQARLHDMWDGWNEVANNWQDTSTRSALLERSRTVAVTLNDTYASLSGQFVANRNQLDAYIDQVNTLATSVADMNQQVVVAQAAGLEANELRDQRDLKVMDLARLTGASAQSKKDGAVNVYVGNGALVADFSARALRLDGPTTLEAVTSASKVALKWTDTGTTATPGGTMGSMLDTMNTIIPGISGKLDEVASKLTTTVNRALAGEVDSNGDPVLDSNGDPITGGYDINGNPGTAMFEGVTAKLIKVVIDDPALVAFSKGFPNDPDSAVAALDNGVADEEMTNLLTYQRGYEAASRVLTTIDSMLDQLINRTGLVGR